MRRWRWVVGLVLLVSACGGGGSDGAADPTGTSSEATGTSSTDPCSGPLPMDGFALNTVAELPTIGDDGNASTLGAEAAAEILDQLISAEGSMCALDVSPGVQEAIDAVRAAAAQGDRSEVRRLLEQLIRVDLQAAASPIKSLRSSYAADDLQKSRDAVAAAAEAYDQGEDDLGDEAMEQAREHYTNYADSAIPATNDPKALLVIARDAMALGLDDVAFDAMEKAKEIYEMELEAVADRYDPCTANPEEAQELALATARVQLIGGDSSSGDVLITKTLEISIDRANGVPVPECESLGFTVEQPVPGWDGRMLVDFFTCDGLSWKGAMALNATLDAGGGQISQVGTAELSVSLPSESSTATSPIVFKRTVTLSTGEATGTHIGESTGTVMLTVDSDAGTAQAVIVLDPSTATVTISAAGRTFSMPAPVSGSTTTFEAPLEIVDSCE